MVEEISQATTPPSGPTRLAASMVWLPAPQAKSRTRIPGRLPAASRSVPVPLDIFLQNDKTDHQQTWGERARCRFTAKSRDLLVRTKSPLSGRQQHSNYSMISCSLFLFPVVGMPSDKKQHDEKPDHIGDRHMPTVAQPGTDRLCLRILVLQSYAG